MLPIKPYRQSEGFCGPAALKMVLEYYGVRITEEELGRRTGCTMEGGVAGTEMARVARELGFMAVLKENASLDDLREWLGKQVPVIVAWFSADTGHYSVVVGMDEENIYLQDPELGHLRALRHDAFLRVWFDYGGEYPASKEEFSIRSFLAICPREHLADKRFLY